MTDHVTYCRICEPLCGLIATVEGGRLVSVRGDKDNPLSQGFHCVKSAAMVDVVYDDDRLLGPVRRTGAPGAFTPVEWDAALGDIAARLSAIRARHGPASIAVFHGNPPAFNYASLLALDGFQRAVGTPYRYGVAAEDGSSRVAANALLFGSPVIVLKPDLWHTDLAILIGTNVLVSHGSGFSEPRAREALDGIVERGGRVIVIDPRRTETARRYEHIPVRAGSDAWLLAAILRDLLARPPRDAAFLRDRVQGLDMLRPAVAPFTFARAEAETGVPAATIRALADAIYESPSALVYGRTGTCTQRFGTLVNALQELVCVVTGNIDRPGGLLFPWGPIDFAKFAEMAGMATYAATHTIVRGLPEVVGMLPSQGLAEDIATDRPDRIRALVVMGGNPVLSSGAGGPPLEDALERLDLLVSLDLYVTETTKHSDYVLPVPTWFERDDLPLMWLGMMLRPTAQATDAVIDRIGETREEWEILDDLARRMGLGGAYTLKVQRSLAKLGVRPSPRTLVDAALRLSRSGDLFGLRRSGISWRKLVARHPHGKALRADLPTGVIADQLRTPDKKINAAPAPILAELTRLDREQADPAFPLRAHGMREVRSHNTWMHNAPRLMPPTRSYAALMNPADAATRTIADGERVVISSRRGTIEVSVSLNDDVAPGNVALPHGWGHDGGWGRANGAGGANSNLLVSTETEDIEPLAAMSVLNGIPVEIRRA